MVFTFVLQAAFFSQFFALLILKNLWLYCEAGFTKVCDRMKSYAAVFSSFRTLLAVTSLILCFGVSASERSEFASKVDEARSVGQTDQVVRLLLQEGQRYRAAGYLRDAQPLVREAVDLASGLQDLGLRALASSALGQLYATPGSNAALIGSWPDPESFFNESLSLAQKSENYGVIALVASRIGEWQLQQGKVRTAADFYTESVRAARLASNPSIQSVALIGLARTQSALQQDDKALKTLERVINLGYSASPQAVVASNLNVISVARELSNSRQIWATVLKENDAWTDQLDNRLLARHYGEMGRWYELEQQLDVSLDYTELALKTAPEAHDLAYDWEWRLGRIFEKMNERSAAINAYRRAARHVEAIRHNILDSHYKGRSSFRQALAPIFLTLADLLMQQADNEPKEKQVQSLLIEAQNVVEQLKSSELQDYFRNVCAINQTQSLSDATLSKTAVLYPVLLPERLALLVKLDGIYHHINVPVASAEVDRTVDSLMDSLQNPNLPVAYRRDAQTLYRWLVEPIKKLLANSDVSTLFFIPDGSLRRMPLAVVWDGEKHLIEKYAIASAPGLTLLNAEPFSSVQPTTLLAGISNPGTVLDEIDPELVEAFLESYRIRRARGLAFRRSTPSTTDDSQRKLDERVEAFSLPGVIDEVEQLSRLVPSTLLLDDEFKLERFRNEISDGSYRVVHIASHGYFGGTAEDSWLMAHDELLDMNELSQLFKPKEFADQPIELLILSACQTAEGNDRAPLGLSGVALSSGARSVLGTLWVVADEATSDFMQTFYRQLRNANNSKAEALRRTQLATIKQERFSHPFYWSSFVLIGSWL